MKVTASKKTSEKLLLFQPIKKVKPKLCEQQVIVEGDNDDDDDNDVNDDNNDDDDDDDDDEAKKASHRGRCEFCMHKSSLPEWIRYPDTGRCNQVDSLEAAAEVAAATTAARTPAFRSSSGNSDYSISGGYCNSSNRRGNRNSDGYSGSAGDG